MTADPNRRRFLATIGLGAVTLAGCTGSMTDDPEENGDPERRVDPPAIDDGELLDDFEEIQWFSIGDTDITGDADETLTGQQSMRLDGDPGDAAGAGRAFPDGLDLSGRDLSLAVRVDSPRPARVVVELHAPLSSDRLTGVRWIPDGFADWLRMDVGYTNRRGEPDLENVQELRVYVQGTDDEDVRFRVDDLRATDGASQGHAVLTFDDGVETQYTTAFPMLEERGWPGVAAVIPDALNRAGRLDAGQLREMRDAGWDVSAHPHEALPDMDSGERPGYLRTANEYLENRGFPDGARHYVAPYNRLDGDSIDDVRDVYGTSFVHGGCPSAVPPTDLHAVSRVNGHDLDAVTSLLDLAAEYDQLVVTMVHGVGDGERDDITEEEFGRLLDAVESNDLEVITVSDLLDRDDL